MRAGNWAFLPLPTRDGTIGRDSHWGEGRGEGLSCPPHPNPLPRSNDLLMTRIDRGGEGENSFSDGSGQSLGADSVPPMIPIIEAPAIRNTQCLLILPN